MGYDTGLTVAHVFEDGKTLPVYVANFVLMEYGTGAIFGCPAHDQRDLDFARKYGLSVTPVVLPKGNIETVWPRLKPWILVDKVLRATIEQTACQ